MAAAVAVLVSGCSDHRLLRPIHDMPAPRADTPLTPDQVKQATDNLISERDHLSTEAQDPPDRGDGRSARQAAHRSKKPPPSCEQPVAAQTAQPAVTGSTQPWCLRQAMITV